MLVCMVLFCGICCVIVLVSGTEVYYTSCKEDLSVKRHLAVTNVY